MEDGRDSAAHTGFQMDCPEAGAAMAFSAWFCRVRTIL
jgi:hypothetical protein